MTFNHLSFTLSLFIHQMAWTLLNGRTFKVSYKLQYGRGVIILRYDWIFFGNSDFQASNQTCHFLITEIPSVIYKYCNSSANVTCNLLTLVKKKIYDVWARFKLPLKLDMLPANEKALIIGSLPIVIEYNQPLGE